MISLSPSAIVRSQARQTLKGNYAAAVGAFMVLLLPVYLVEGLAVIIDAILYQLISDRVLYGVLEIVILTPVIILSIVFLSPLLNGFIRIFYKSAYTRKCNFSDLFYYFSSGRYHNTLHLNLALTIRLMLPAVMCFLPLIAYYIFCFSLMPDFVGTTLYMDFEFILAVMSAILLILYSLKYFVVFALYCEDDSADVQTIFRASKEIMNEQKSSATKLIFSFTPWMLLCLLIIPALYVVPYMTQSLCIGAKWMIMKGK